MSMDKLIAMFDAHSKQHINKAWTDTNTRDALWDEKREKAEAEEKEKKKQKELAGLTHHTDEWGHPYTQKEKKKNKKNKILRT